MTDQVAHPDHYGGDVPTEPIKIIRAWGLGFALGNAVKYIARAGRKPGADAKTDLSKAIFYIDDEIIRGEMSEREPLFVLSAREVGVLEDYRRYGSSASDKTYVQVCAIVDRLVEERDLVS